MSRGAVVTALDALLAAAPAGTITGVLLVRLQRVREFLQVYGYASGDALSRAARERLEGLLGHGEQLHQAGEFEFVVVVPSLRGPADAKHAGSRIRQAFWVPMRVAGRETMVPAAVGVATTPAPGLDAETLLRHAEYAYTRAMRRSSGTALHVPGEEPPRIPWAHLREAIASHRLEAWLQPILDLRSRRIVGAESLTRWHDPVFGRVPPDHFIPVAERSGLISPLTWWSIDASLDHLARARELAPALGISINLSPRVFDEPSLVAHLVAAAAARNLPTDAVTLEVTETALMEDLALGKRVLARLRDAGFGIALDDFGTGYSSLAYLKRIPATVLKIDQAFVRRIEAAPRVVALVDTIVKLAHGLGLTVVAEGVEDSTTLELLAGIGCDRAQGYFIQRPQPLEEFLQGVRPADPC